MTKYQIEMLKVLVAAAEAPNAVDPVGCVFPTALIITRQADKPVMGSLLNMGLIGTAPDIPGKVWLTAEGVMASKTISYTAKEISEFKREAIKTLSEDIPWVSVGEVWEALTHMTALVPVSDQIKLSRERER